MTTDNTLTDKLTQIIAIQASLASAEFDLDEFMDLVVGRMQELTPATGAVIELLENDEMVYHAASGSVKNTVGLRLKRAGSLSGLCVTEGDIKVSHDTSTDDRVDAAACKRIGAASMVCMPLFQRGKAVGVLKVLSTSTQAFSDADIQTLNLMAGLLGGALGQQMEVNKRKELEEKLRFMAQHDELTRIPNRALFYDRLRQAILRCARNKTQVALLYMDIDKFKSINDTHGHGIGDELLCAFAERVSGLIRASDTFARLGGDEFAIVAENINGKEGIQSLAEKIVNGCREEYKLSKVNLVATTSIGAAMCDSSLVDPDALVQVADAALYQTKRNGRNGFSIADAIEDRKSSSGNV